MENLQLGSDGEDVKRLQERLTEFGFYKGEINGSFDEETKAAVIAFQESEGLAADGMVGLMTLHELDLLQSDSTDEENSGETNNA